MITMLKQGERYVIDKHGLYTEYICSNADDIDNLPTGADTEALDRPRPGSTAVVPSTDGGAASVYVLSNEHNWVLLSEG